MNMNINTTWKWTVKAVLTGMLFVGMMVGSSFWGYVSDTRGRRVVVLCTSLVSVVFGVLSSMASSFMSFLVFRFCVGFMLSASHASATYFNESIPTTR